MVELDQIPDKIEKALLLNDQIKEIAAIYKDHPNALYLESAVKSLFVIHEIVINP